MHRLLSFWAALGIIATSATQLRFGGAPVGMGELLLAVWILFAAFLLLRGMPVITGPTFWFVLGSWMISAALLGFGAVVALSTRRFDVANAGHDAVAFAFLAVLTPLLALKPSGGEDNAYHESMARYAFAIFAVCAGSMLLVAYLVPAVGPVNLWYAELRFLGWAENPNQMALFALGMPFLGCFLLQGARRARHKVVYGIGILSCVLVGLATLSDGLKLSWVVGLGSVAALAWSRAVLRTRGRFLYITHILVPFLLVLVLVTAAGELYLRGLEWGEATYQEADQGLKRFTLWANGAKAILQSPVVGFGPGAHSGFLGPFESFEAHNALIDWGTSTGVAGIMLHIVLVIWCARRALSAGSFVLFGMVMALTVFGLFAYTLRQPIYWFFLILGARLSERRIGATAPAIRSLDPIEVAAPRRRRLGRAHSVTLSKRLSS